MRGELCSLLERRCSDSSENGLRGLEPAILNTSGFSLLLSLLHVNICTALNTSCRAAKLPLIFASFFQYPPLTDTVLLLQKPEWKHESEKSKVTPDSGGSGERAHQLDGGDVCDFKNCSLTTITQSWRQLNIQALLLIYRLPI